MAKDIVVLVVDPRDYSIRELVVKDKLKSYQKLVGGPVEGHYAINQHFPRHMFYVNEEAKILRGPYYGWRIRGWDETLIGPGVLFRLAGQVHLHPKVTPEELGEVIEFCGEVVPETPTWRYVSL